jgi:hypothetical protein
VEVTLLYFLGHSVIVQPLIFVAPEHLAGKHVGSNSNLVLRSTLLFTALTPQTAKHAAMMVAEVCYTPRSFSKALADISLQRLVIQAITVQMTRLETHDVVQM